MNQRKSSGKTAANERSQASKGGRKSDTQGGRTGGEASSGSASGQGNRSQSEDARHGIQQSRKSSSK